MRERISDHRTPFPDEIPERTTYLLTFFAGGWHVYRHTDEVALVASYLPTKQEALEVALTLAREDRPSQVIRTERSGESCVIGTFESVL